MHKIDDLTRKTNFFLFGAQCLSLEISSWVLCFFGCFGDIFRAYGRYSILMGCIYRFVHKILP